MNKKWPENLIEDIFCIIDDEEKKKEFWTEYGKVTEDREKGLEYVLGQLSEKKRTAIYARYFFQATYADCGRMFNVTQQGARVIIHNAIKEIRHLRGGELMKYIQQGLSAREETLRLREERAEELRIACQNAFLGTISKKDRASIIMELPLETVSYLSPFMLKSLHDLGYQTIGDLTRHYDSYMAWEENQKKVINLSVVTKHVMERTGLIKNYSVLDYETKKKESRYNG